MSLVDIETYDFETLKEEDLGALLDEDINELNDETFGALEDSRPVGRDFDFAGSTSRFLGNEQPMSADSPWLSAPSSNQQQQQGLGQEQKQSKPTAFWSGLEDDPLLSGRAQQQQQPARQARTLEEIEAEMLQQQQQAPPRKALTLEEVEAEMLKQASASPMPQPQQQHQQRAFPPGMFPQGPFPPHGQQGFAPPPFGARLPPGMPPLGYPQPGSPFGAFGPPPGQRMPLPGFPGSMPPAPPPGMQALHQQQQQQQQQQPSTLSAPAQQPSAPLETMFPPLPSQGGISAVAQQLQYLSLNQKNQHPSLTSAQLQALLQQAQRHVAAPQGADDAEKDKMAKAGEELIKNVEERIREHEVVEARRKKVAAKVSHMAQHNGLMSESDKHFITRIQVSQLVTDDPYADDFYFHIMSAIKMNRAAQAAAAAGKGPLAPPSAQQQQQNGQAGPSQQQQQQKQQTEETNAKSGTKRKAGVARRETAMNRMAQNVQRLIDSAKQKNKTAHGQLTVDGALGKIAVRTRSAPRQLLQVPGSGKGASGSANTAHQSLLDDLLTGQNAGGGGEATSDKPLDRRALLTITEHVYDVVLDLEQMKRIHQTLLNEIGMLKRVLEEKPDEEPAQERLSTLEANLKRWENDYAEKVDNLWRGLRVMDPLDACVPHPFVAILSLAKGKRILPRAMRHLSAEQNLTILTLLVATFNTLDTVVDAPKLDEMDPRGSLESRRTRQEVFARTEAFLHAIVNPIMGVINNAPLRMITGMVGLLMDRNDVVQTIKSKPGITLVTLFLSRAASLKQQQPGSAVVDEQDLAQWQQTFSHLFNTISVDLPSLFPSSRAIASLPFGANLYHQSQLELARPDIDREDEPVWQMLAAFAVNADLSEQQTLVTGVREKVLENVAGSKRKGVDPAAAEMKLRNVNLLLHSLGLDASQLSVE